MLLYVYENDNLREVVSAMNHSRIQMASLLLEIEEKYGDSVDIFLTKKHYTDPIKERAEGWANSIYVSTFGE